MKTNFEKLENSEIKMTISVNKEKFEKYRNLGLKKVQEFVQIDGFRKGNAPENLIVDKYGDMVILEEMAHLAINETYYAALIKENENKKDEDKIMPIVEPKINITKIGKGSDFEYTATFSVMPHIDLPDYKKISKEEVERTEKEYLEELKKTNEKVEKSDIYKVTDTEVNDVIEGLRKAKTKGGHVHEDGTVHTHSHDKESESEDSGNIEKDIQQDLPELNDEFAQSFGQSFKTMEDLRVKIKSNLELEKKSKISERKRTNVLEKLVSESNINIPDVLIKDEQERMKAQMKADVERFGGKWEDYLAHLKKTEEELKEEWKEVAHKRLSSQLIVNKIAQKENIKVSPDEIDAEAIKIMQQMPEAKEDHVKRYVEQILANEKVMKILEGNN